MPVPLSAHCAGRDVFGARDGRRLKTKERTPDGKTKGARVKMRLRRGSADYRSSQHVIDRLTRARSSNRSRKGGRGTQGQGRAEIDAACDTFCCLSRCNATLAAQEVWVVLSTLQTPLCTLLSVHSSLHTPLSLSFSRCRRVRHANAA